MKPITIELDHSEFRILRGTAYKQIRTPENLARYLIVKGLGLTSDEQLPATNNNTDILDLVNRNVRVAA